MTRLAYADPPYPGRAHLYKDHPDYAGEVDHLELIEKLCGYDGWALSTSAEALRNILPICPVEARVLAWVKHTVTVSWEPVIVCSARAPHGVRDWIQVEPDSYQWRPKPDAYVIGQKPKAFCMWLFAWLGAEPGDELDDLFPGSGQVGVAWREWRQQPAFRPRVVAVCGEAGRAAREGAREPAAAVPRHPLVCLRYGRLRSGRHPRQPVTRREVIRRVRNWWGNRRGFGTCYRCGDSWSWAEWHDTSYLLGRGCLPLCERCWATLPPSERLPFYRMLWESWERDIPGYASWDDIQTAVEAGL